MQESRFKYRDMPTSYKFIFKNLLVQTFSCEFCQIFHDTFLAEHLWATPYTTYPFVRWVNLIPKILLSTCFFISFKHF